MEIDPLIQHLVDGFVADWNGNFYGTPQFQLDYSFPSLANIDSFLLPLRSAEDIDSELDQVIAVASGYLGIIVADVWSNYPDSPSVKLYYEGTDVVINASGGGYLPGKTEFSVNITRNLKTLLRDTPNPFPIVANYKRRITKWQGVVSLFTLSLCSGGTPFGEGPWKLLPKSELESFFESASKTLGEGVARFYTSCFPEEEKGQNPKLYHGNILVPPDAAGNAPLGVPAPVHLIKNIKELYGNTDNEELVINLCNLPDQHLSVSAIVAASALCYPSIPMRLKAAAYSKSLFLPMQRGAVYALRKFLGKPHCWQEEIAGGRVQVATKLAAQEKALYFTPLLYIPVHLLTRPGYEILTETIQWSAKYEIVAACQQILRLEHEPPIELYFQELFIHCFVGDTKSSEKVIEDIYERYSNKCLDYFGYHQLLGWNFTNQGEFGKASEHFEEAVKLEHSDSFEIVRLYLLWANSLVAENEIGYALALIENCLEKFEWSAEVLEAKYKLLKKSGDQKGADHLSEKLLKLYSSQEVIFETKLRATE